MKSKTTIYIAVIIFLVMICAVSGYYSKGTWLKGQLESVSKPAVNQNVVSVGGYEATVSSTPVVPAENTTPQCQPDNTVKVPTIFCLSATPSKWDPKKDNIRFSYVLAGSSGLNLIRKTVSDADGSPVRLFADEKNLASGAHVTSWSGTLDDNSLITPGHYSLHIYGKENGADIKDATLDFEAI